MMVNLEKLKQSVLEEIETGNRDSSEVVNETIDFIAKYFVIGGIPEGYVLIKKNLLQKWYNSKRARK